MDDTLVAICKEEADRYLSLHNFIREVQCELAREERGLADPVFYTLNCITWAILELKEGIEDLRMIYLKDVSTLVVNSRSKIINLLKELHDNLQLSKPKTKQKIMDCAVRFEKDSISAFKRHLDLEYYLLLSYRFKYVDDVPLNKNTSTLISKRSDVRIPSEHMASLPFLIVGSGSHKSPNGGTREV